MQLSRVSSALRGYVTCFVRRERVSGQQRRMSLKCRLRQHPRQLLLRLPSRALRKRIPMRRY